LDNSPQSNGAAPVAFERFGYGWARAGSPNDAVVDGAIKAPPPESPFPPPPALSFSEKLAAALLHHAYECEALRSGVLLRKEQALALRAEFAARAKAGDAQAWDRLAPVASACGMEKDAFLEGELQRERDRRARILQLEEFEELGATMIGAARSEDNADGEDGLWTVLAKVAARMPGYRPWTL
jgi:hypothetical protein